MKNALVLIAGSLASMLCQAAPAMPEDAEVRAQLLAGEIVTRQSSSDGAGASGRMQVLVTAPARAVWEVVVSCELAFTFVDGLRQCEVLEESGDRVLVHQVVNPSWLIPTYDYVFESLRLSYKRIDVRLLEGNLDALEGYWSFEETSEGTVVDYQIRIKPSLPAPRFLVHRNIRKGMPDMLACIRGLAGGSVPASGAHLDLARCPGPLPAGLGDQ